MTQFDPFRQAALNSGYQKMKDASFAPKEYTLDELKKLAGVNDPVNDQVTQSLTGSDKARIMREQNIKPGTDAWFRLHFAKTHLTGEKPI
jgi:hypothetical protein